MTYYLRTEETAEDAVRAFYRKRSANGWWYIGLDPVDWLMCAAQPHEIMECADLVGIDIPSSFGCADAVDELIAKAQDDALNTVIIDVLGLEPAEGRGYWRPLPGLCALAEADEDLPNAEWIARATHFGEAFAMFAVYEGESVGVDENVEDATSWTLFRPARLVRVFENPGPITRREFALR